MYSIVKYDPSKNEIWDQFVLNQSVNGTFLQTMKFLGYHPDGKFTDESFLIYDRYEIAAVVPGCHIDDNGKQCFFSHKGTSYGGIIVNKYYYTGERIIKIVETVNNYLKRNFDKAILKITPDLFGKETSDLLRYALYYAGFSHYSELSTYVDLHNFPDDVKYKFDRNKRRNINKCIEKGVTFTLMEAPEQIDGFHELLTINLSKFGVKPIHTKDDLHKLKYQLFNDRIIFMGVHDSDKLVAAGMVFDFEGQVLHAQNLSYNINIKDYSPITYLYYKLIEYAKANEYRYVSWGISTEDCGKKLNMGLIRNKESYGSKYQVNCTFFKEFSND